MQLVFETQPNAEDINMSTQIVNPINGSICEIVTDINVVADSKDATTTAQLEGSLSNGAELSTSKISKNIGFEEEICHDDVTMTDNCSPKEIEVLKEDSLAINGNITILDELCNGSNCNEDSNELELSSDHDLITKEAIDSECCQQSNSTDNAKGSVIPEVTVVSSNLVKPLSLTVNTDEESGNFAVCNSKDIKNTIKQSAVPENEINSDDIAMLEEINNPSKVSNGASSSNLELSNVETELTNDKYLGNDVVIHEPIPIVEPIGIAISKIDVSKTIEEVDTDKTIKTVEQVDDSKDITMLDVDDIDHTEKKALGNYLKPSESSENVIKSIQEISISNENNVENIILSQEYCSDPVKMDKGVLKTIQSTLVSDHVNVENRITQVDETKPIEIDEEVLEPFKEPLVIAQSSIQNESLKENTDDSKSIEIDNVISETSKHIFGEDQDIIQNIALEKNIDISMAEPNVRSFNINSVGDSVTKTDVDGVQEEDSILQQIKVKESVTNTAVKTVELNVVTNDGRQGYSLMETEDAEVVNLEKDIIETSLVKEKTVAHSDVIKEITTVKEMTEEEMVPRIALEIKPSGGSVVAPKDIEKINKAVAFDENNSSINSKDDKAINFNMCQESVNILDEDDVKIVENKLNEDIITSKNENSPNIQTIPDVCKLSNTLNILSDDEEETSNVCSNSPKSIEEKHCINIDDDDDVMLIEEDSNSKETIPKDKPEESNNTEEASSTITDDKVDLGTEEHEPTNMVELAPKIYDKESLQEDVSTMDSDSIPQTDNISVEPDNNVNTKNPLLPQNFLKTAKKNLGGMSRHELEDFCILRIVESIVDRSNLSDIKSKVKAMAQNLEDYRKRALMMTKQNRDLQVVLKSVQEEQKKRTNALIQPLKITRSVGMQVLMNDKLDPRRKGPIASPAQAANVPSRPIRSTQSLKLTKPPGTPPIIPVPRKVPVNNSPAKAITNAPPNNMINKSASPNPIGASLRNPSPVQKGPEKRTHSRMQATSSVTVDLTDDEPPAKMNNKNPTTPPVRVVPSQNLLAQNRQFGAPSINNPRKVYIPISGPSGQIRPGQTLMMKNMPTTGPRQRGPILRPQQNAPRPKQIPRHPAPLPDAMKQYTPPTWKALPPAPDLKLSKVENGIVISWKIDGYPEGGYETIASYQLYAYQETTAPPCTALWKKIGDVKALPLPMACTLTQFMAGFKYYFAVRAVDVRSRLGPFSLPGSILLLNKV